jgi:hypothetical protein
LGYKLHIVKNEKAEDWSNSQTHLRFTVVDSERGKNYPLNFVCLLPMRFTLKEDRLTMFEKLFGADSLQVAKKLLSDALETEQDGDVKNEIERRLRLLSPELPHKQVCSSCGKPFQADSKKSWKRNFCLECGKKRFGYHTAAE